MKRDENGFDEEMFKMKPFKNILFPVVFSKASEDIVPYIHIMAKQFKSHIHLLLVVPVCESLFKIQPEKEIIIEAKRRLLAFKNHHFSAFPDTVTSVAAGDAWEEIIYYIHLKAIDLVIMGTQNRKGFDNIIFGSVAERVIKTAPVPVLVVNPYRLLNNSYIAHKKTKTAETVNHGQLQN